MHLRILSKLRLFLSDFLHTYTTVLKMIIPVMIVLKLITYTSIIPQIGAFFAPLMSYLGLPADASIVVTTTALTSMYAGMIAWNTLSLPLSVAQATTLSGMMLAAHTLPIELQVAKKAGVSVWVSLLWRLGGMLLFGILVHLACTYLGVFQTPAHVVFKPEPQAHTLAAWAVAQFGILGKIGLILMGLMLMMRLFRRLKITHALEWLLRPILGKIGISERVIPLTVIGMVLGLVYGGALIIREASQGHLTSEEIFFSLAFLNLCHSIFEDSMLGVMMGGNMMILVLGRFVFAYAAVGTLFYLKQRLIKRSL